VAPEQARRDLLTDLDAARRRLPRTQRQLVALRQLGLTTQECAQAAGLAEGSVRPLLSRAQRRLRELLTVPPEPMNSEGKPPPPPLLEWSAAVEAWLSQLELARATRESYRRSLSAAGVALGRTPLAALAPADLARYRIALLGSRQTRRSQAHALGVVAAFLPWAGERGLHALDAASIRTALGRRQRRRHGRPGVVGAAMGARPAAPAETPPGTSGRPDPPGGT
jgi:hypothetical protein